MISEKVQKDARVRQESRMLRITRNNRRREEQISALPAPEVVGVIPDYDGLLPAEKLQENLKIKIQKWDSGTGFEPGDNDRVILRLKDAGGVIQYTSNTDYSLPLDDAAFPTTVEIPVAEIPAQGVYSVEYTVRLWNGNPTDSDPSPIIIDRQPPYFNPGHPATPAAIILPVEVVTDQYLADNGNELVCTLPDYPSDRARGDQVSVYLGLELPENIDVVPVVGPIDVPDDLKIHIPAAEIQTRQDGNNYILYWLNDKAGNFSDISAPISIDVQLGPMPDDLKQPEVPLGPLITRADALEPVTVEIPAFTGAEKVTIKALWGGTALSELRPGPSPAFPLVIQVPWSTLKAEYDFAGAAEQPVRVSYQAWRGSLPFPVTGPLFEDVQVDLSVVGPVNPDPDPVNPNLPLVHLTSFTGQTDKLTVADKGQAATATTLLHESPENEEIIELYWRDTIVDQHTVNGESEGDTITFDITWEQLLEGGNDPKFPMTYTIRGKDANNYQRSKTTEVDVDIVTIDLDVPTFPSKDPDVGIINCSSLECGTQALPVRIPGSIHLTDGDELRLDAAGYDLSDILVPGTEFSLNHTLQSGEAAGGVTLRIEPYSEYILPIINGRIRARYTVLIGGVIIQSAVASERVSLFDGAGGTCPIVPC